MDKPKIVQFNKEREQVDNLVKVTYRDGTFELLDATEFGFVDELPGFIHFWRDIPYTPLGFLNERDVRKIEIIPREKENDTIDS